MGRQEMKGLLAIWADIDEDYRMEFEKWHNCEHMADRVKLNLYKETSIVNGKS